MKHEKIVVCSQDLNSGLCKAKELCELWHMKLQLFFAQIYIGCPVLDSNTELTEQEEMTLIAEMSMF